MLLAVEAHELQQGWFADERKHTSDDGPSLVVWGVAAGRACRGIRVRLGRHPRFLSRWIWAVRATGFCASTAVLFSMTCGRERCFSADPG